MTSTTTVGKSSDNLSELVFQKIKNDIFDFQLKPGARFTESEIAELYEVSRTPVRQALYRLQRILLECYAIEQLCNMPSEQLKQALQELVNLWCIQPAQYLHDLKTVSMQDEAFHCQLVEAIGNTEMAKVHRDVSEKIRIIRRLDFSKDYRIDATYAEHQKILEQILSKNKDLALNSIRAHIIQSRDAVKKITLEMLALL